MPAHKTLSRVDGSSRSGKNGHMRQTRRVTFAIDQEIDNLLEVYCNSSGNPKNEVAEKAIAEHLAQRKKDLQQALKKSEEAINQLPMPA